MTFSWAKPFVSRDGFSRILRSPVWSSTLSRAAAAPEGSANRKRLSMAPPFESRKAFLEVALLAIFLGFRTPSSIAQSTTTASLEHGGDEEQACEINLNLIFDA